MSTSPPPGLDPEQLRGYLDRERPGLVDGPLRARLIEGGRSNLTYVVTDGAHRWVVRRPPLGHVLATAHDMKREHRVISALHPTSVPVPRPVLLCDDESVLGAPFYVIEFVTGTPYRTADQLAPLGPTVQRFNIRHLVREPIRPGVDFYGGKAVEHEGVVGIGRVTDANGDGGFRHGFPFAACSKRQ